MGLIWHAWTAGDPVPAEGGKNLTRHLGYTIGGVIIGLILLAWLPWYVTVLVIAAAIAIPAAAYLMLDPSQRRKLRQSRRRGQLGR